MGFLSGPRRIKTLVFEICIRHSSSRRLPVQPQPELTSFPTYRSTYYGNRPYMTRISLQGEARARRPSVLHAPNDKNAPPHPTHLPTTPKTKQKVLNTLKFYLAQVRSRTSIFPREGKATNRRQGSSTNNTSTA